MPSESATTARPTIRRRAAAVGEIDTLGAPMALVAIDAPPSSGRAERSATLTKFFFDGFDKLLGPDNDPSWREVNFAAVAPWPRLPAAQAWIKLNTAASSSSLDAFRAVAKTAAAANGRSRRGGFRSLVRQSDAMARDGTMTEGDACRSF